MSRAGSATFLPPKLLNLFKPNSPNVLSTMASTSTASIESVAEHLFGPHHKHAHHSTHSDEVKEHDEGQSGGTMDQLMGKLHLIKSGGGEGQEQFAGGEGKDKDVENPAVDQWRSMRVLRGGELEEIRQCGQWGLAQPSDLFLNVSGKVSLRCPQDLG